MAFLLLAVRIPMVSDQPFRSNPIGRSDDADRPFRGFPIRR